LEVVEDPSEADSIRILSLRAAAQGPAPQWIESAAEVLKSSEGSGPELRAEIANQIGVVAMFTNEGHHAMPTIRQALKSVLNARESLPVRIAALYALATEGDPDALELLKNALRAREEALVPLEQAVKILATARPGENLDIFRTLLSADEKDDVRRAALLSLGSDAESLNDRRAILRNTAEPPAIREAAFRSLMHSDPTFLDQALALLHDTGESTSMRAAAAAGLQIYVTYYSQSLTREDLQRLQEQLSAFQAEDRLLQQTVKRTAEKIARWAEAKQ